MHIAEDELQQRILSVLAKKGFVRAENITLDTPIKDLGLDSLDTIQILFTLEEELGIEIEAEGFRDVTTLREIFDMISGSVATAH